MKFDYRQYVSDDDIVVYRPVVTLRIIGPSGNVRWDALVDTGSDITLLPSAIGKDIGIDLAVAERSAVRGVGDQSIETRDNRVNLELTDGVQICRWEADVSFLAADGAESHLALLGHRGCLNFFSAWFDADTRTMELLPAKGYSGTVEVAR
jgi:predicted aspartyl protease